MYIRGLEEFQIEIDTDKILEEVESFMNHHKSNGSILKKTYTDIVTNDDIVIKTKELYEYRLLEEIYVAPLQEFANRIANYKKINHNDLMSSSYSIMMKMLKLKDFLLENGCTLETILESIPKTTEEIKILMEAKTNGYDLSYNNTKSLRNTDRINEAKTYLNTEETKDRAK